MLLRQVLLRPAQTQPVPLLAARTRSVPLLAEAMPPEALAAQRLVLARTMMVRREPPSLAELRHRPAATLGRSGAPHVRRHRMVR